MTKHLWWVLAFFLWLTSYAQAATPFSTLTYAQALAAAKHAHKLLIIDFYTSWCGPCHQMDEVTWTDPKVQAWLQSHAVALRVDAEKDQALADRYKIRAYPTVLFLKANQTEADRLIGFRDPAKFLSDGDGILHGQNTLARLTSQMEHGHAEDPMLRMQLGDELANRGRESEALTHYLWCFDNGDSQPGFGAVRLTFLLSRIVNLAHDYPPAGQALQTRRAAAEKALMGQHPTDQTASDLAALNKALQGPERTLKTYDSLHDAAARTALFSQVVRQLVEDHRYKDVLEGVGDVNHEIDRYLSSYDYVERKQPRADVLKAMRKVTVQHCGLYYEALLGSQQAEAAQAVADRLIKFNGGADIWIVLMQHAVHAGNLATAHRLADAGQKAVPESEKGKMDDAVQEAFKSPSSSPSP